MRAIHMLRFSQEVQVGAAAVGLAMRVLEHDGVADGPRHVHAGIASAQLLDGGPSGAPAVLKVDKRLGKHTIKRGLRVRA